MSVKPRIKLSKTAAQKGEFMEVRTLVPHLIESEQRKDKAGRTIPRKIINRFVCAVNGKEIFSADLEPAIAENPFIQFKFKAEESGAVVFTWIDDVGSKIVAKERLSVE
jgi:sulfur-oxidizing protein SoxZ